MGDKVDLYFTLDQSRVPVREVIVEETVKEEL